MDFKKYIAELLGTMFLVLVGCGSAVAYSFSAGWLAVSLAFGLTVMAMTYCFMKFSGCHINPAVSLAMLICKKIDFKDFIAYIIAQFVGGIIGAAVLMIFFDASTGLGANGYDALSSWDLNWWQALIAEILLTNLFVMVFLATSGRKHKYSVGIINGLTFAMVYIIAIPLTNASINPARSLAPAIFVGGMALRQVWLFIVAPMIGAALAAVGYKWFCIKEEKLISDDIM
ncbi:MAG: aquaporin [Clostridia bacterium]|nr:aquaporin [Clostridia bacterium]